MQYSYSLPLLANPAMFDQLFEYIIAVANIIL